MTLNDKPGRRRALVTATAALTAAAILGGLGFLATTSSPAGASSATDPAPQASGAGPVSITTPAPVTPSDSTSPAADTTAAAPPQIRNVVLILADDLDWALFNQVPRLAALKDEGLTFTHHVVTDSLCCPSRTSILRGQYIHNHMVVSNMAATGGGWPTFRARNEENDCLPVWLNASGIHTGLFGKYLNDYPSSPRTARYVPPGWDSWAVPISRSDSYSGYDYTLNDNGRLRKYGKRPSAFLNDVITTKATDFIQTAPEGFFAELATYNPHKPSPVAVRNRGTHAATVAPRSPNFNSYGTNEPTWLRTIPPLGPAQVSNADRRWRQRAESAESVADSVVAVRAALAASGRTDDTLIVVTSDNGYHSGTHRLIRGKRTAYREDTVVPMVVIGPGVPAGRTVDAMTSTVDLAPTLLSILGGQGPQWLDGRSLAPFLSSGETPDGWRTGVISESMGLSGPDDPDYQEQAPPPFTALRTQDWLFVVYRDGERELYDLNADPFELNNIASSADPQLIATLYSQLQAMRSCAGESCRVADTFTLPITVSTPAASPAATPSATPAP